MQEPKMLSPAPEPADYYGAAFQEPEIHLRDYIAVLFVRKWLVLSCFLAVMIACLYYLKTTPPTYKATAVLLYEKNRSTPVLLEELQLAPSSLQIEAQQRILQSPLILAEIAARVNTQPGFNVAREPLSKSISLTSPRNTDILEISAEALTPEGAALIANTATRVYLEKTAERKHSDLDQVIDFLKAQMTAVNQLLEKSEQELNTFRERYGIIPQVKEGLVTGSGLLQQLGQMQQDLLDTQTQVQLAKVRLGSITELLKKYQRQNPEADATLQTFKGASYIQQLQGKIIDLQIALGAAQQEYTEKSDQVVTLKQQLDAAQTQLEKEFKGLVSQDGVGGLDPLSEWQNLMRQEIDLTVELRGLEQKQTLIEANIEKFKVEHPELISKEVELMQLGRKSRQYEETYGFLMKKYEETRMLRQMQASDLSIITNALPPESPIKPKKMLTLLLGGVLGVMLGVGSAFFLEYMDDSLRKKEDIERWLGLPVVGAIPTIPLNHKRGREVSALVGIGNGDPTESTEERERALDTPAGQTHRSAPTVSKGHRKRKHSENYYKRRHALISRSIPHLAKNIAENYRSLMAAIQFAQVDLPITTLLITSSTPSEGKTLTAGNLAITYAQSGKKTLLIDLDLRRPQQHVLFSQEREPGFSDYFASLALPQPQSTNGLIRETHIPNLHLLPCGQIPPNPIALLGSDKMLALLEEWKKEYDLILIDTPPLLSVADAAIVARNVDTTLLIVEAGKTNRQIASQAKAVLDQVGVPISGVVLNNVDFSKHYGGYYYYHYYRYYHRYYSDSSEEETS
ncbi:polysaccharide biosynthesis tyrosine autokinase [Candidatus Poribacteria bacterium]|nr:polysaccharide biosynthesis tyrosine autokinase [Candidatus Poribacteria bacterium]